MMKMTKTIAILSAKGGVGKTTLSINLASALNSFGRNVTLVDGNLETPNVGLYLGASTLPITLNHVLSGEETLQNAIYNHPNGLKIIPSSINLSTIKTTKKENFSKVFNNIKSISEIIIVDTQPTINNFHIFDSVDEAFIVTTPDLVSVTGALKMVHAAEENGVTVLGTILNKVKGDKLELAKDNIESILEKPIIGEIPYDENVRVSNSLKDPVIYTEPNSKSSVAFRKIAAELLGQRFYEPEEKKSFFKRIFSK